MPIPRGLCARPGCNQDLPPGYKGKVCPPGTDCHREADKIRKRVERTGSPTLRRGGYHRLRSRWDHSTRLLATRGEGKVEWKLGGAPPRGPVHEYQSHYAGHPGDIEGGWCKPKVPRADERPTVPAPDGVCPGCFRLWLRWGHGRSCGPCLNGSLRIAYPLSDTSRDKARREPDALDRRRTDDFWRGEAARRRRRDDPLARRRARSAWMQHPPPKPEPAPMPVLVLPISQPRELVAA